MLPLLPHIKWRPFIRDLGGGASWGQAFTGLRAPDAWLVSLRDSPGGHGILTVGFGGGRPVGHMWAVGGRGSCTVFMAICWPDSFLLRGHLQVIAQGPPMVGRAVC